LLEAKYFGVPVIEGTSVIFGSSKVQRESAALVLMEMYTLDTSPVGVLYRCTASEESILLKSLFSPDHGHYVSVLGVFTVAGVAN